MPNYARADGIRCLATPSFFESTPSVCGFKDAVGPRGSHMIRDIGPGSNLPRAPFRFHVSLAECTVRHGPKAWLKGRRTPLVSHGRSEPLPPVRYLDLKYLKQLPLSEKQEPVVHYFGYF